MQIVNNEIDICKKLLKYSLRDLRIKESNSSSVNVTFLLLKVLSLVYKFLSIV